MAAMPNAPARPPRVDDPLFTTSNGIHLLAISETNENYMEHGGHALVPLAENTWAFTTVSALSPSPRLPSRFRDTNCVLSSSR